MGASDSPPLFDLSPHKTKRDLWFEKAGLGEPDDEDRSYIFRKGHEAEAELRELVSKHAKMEINPTCFENGIFGASLDGYDKALGVLEAKLVGKDVLERAKSLNEIPEHHRIQIQHQLYATESDKAYWVAKDMKSKGGHVIPIGRDETFIKTLRKEVERFWETLQDVEPPPLSDRDTMFLVDPKQVEIFQNLAKLKFQKDTLERMYEDLEKKAKALATHTRVKCANVLVLEIERAGSIEYGKIPEVKALAEEYIESFRKKSSRYKSIRFGKAE
jgi:putative phage-type endonuclease